MICFIHIIVIYCFLIYGHTGQISGCPTNCVNCDDNSKKCQVCLTGYYINNINQCSLCPLSCSECSSSTQCSKCTHKYWNRDCNSECSTFCDDSGCEDINGYCQNCPLGFYGTFCQHPCSLCKTQLCDLRQCRDGCIDGYYLLTLDSSTSCDKCPRNCRICESGSICSECNSGFYKQSYNNSNGNLLASCFKCYTDCGDCSEFSKCTSCKPGKYGASCEKNCTILNCQKCIESWDIETCTSCETGYTLYNNKCSTCISNNGLCLQNCTNGFWDKNCDKACPDGCSTCDNTNGSCKICNRDKYGEFCQLTCSDNCVDEGSILCDKDSGKCTAGCKDGYIGSRCELATSSTTDSTRTKTTARRQTEQTDGHETVTEASQHTVVIIGAAAGGGAFIVIVVGIVVIVCLIRRR